MKKLAWILFLAALYISCSKSTPPVTPTTPPSNPSAPTTPTTPTTPTNPATPSTPATPPSGDILNGWVKINKPASLLNDVWFTGNRIGFTTTGTSLLTSKDNGLTWSQIAAVTQGSIYNFQFVDDQHGFVQGNQQMGVTLDGGSTWSFKPLASGENYAVNFQFVTVSTGFYFNHSNMFFRTADAGDHWNPMTGFSGSVTCFYFLDSLNGFYMNTNSCNRTSDGGLNWTKISAGTFSALGTQFDKIQFLDVLNGYSGGTKGLFKTTDGGITWSLSLSSSIAASVQGFIIPEFFDVNNGYCLVGNTIYKTTDGGAHWELSCSVTGDYFSGFHMLDMNTGWASTFGGYILRL